MADEADKDPATSDADAAAMMDELDLDENAQQARDARADSDGSDAEIQCAPGMSKYEDVREVGRGAFGKVRLVKRKDNGVLYVVKRITDKTDRLSEKRLADMELEVKVLKQLRHPHIILYEESFHHEGCLCIVQEYAERGTLAYQISGWKSKGEVPDELDILDVFVQLVLAMDHIHSLKVMHRDLKPENIMVTKGDIIKLGDFGLCKVLSGPEKKATSCSGTPNYMSPEVIEGRPYDFKCDMWAMGCVLYEMIALKKAFGGSDIDLVLAITHSDYEQLECCNASPRVRKLVNSLLSHCPRDRPNTTDLLNMSFIENVQHNLQARLADVPVAYGANESIPYSEAYAEVYGSHGKVAATVETMVNEMMPVRSSFADAFDHDIEYASSLDNSSGVHRSMSHSVKYSTDSDRIACMKKSSSVGLLAQLDADGF
mmetsp:Transcript_509/g.571  ORF Transcript_509/g.571 Transcript_509/m.571 type:complete len:429 (-) Transcript_509:829-2115(-)|eukprot:CAMPEP_0197867840 /NCGR_PEP_ID=MMETSP1438-20131217/44963_1 /TAXON_ID=1461541 /ORGANISM="Pterosperma sp., Strain CCMP1384" /LENGTH=428 /DNA_ID=CAMNT_0043486509 /DNA_START=469 /DNA_END=1755 /DNA_ORIENTATION=+